MSMTSFSGTPNLTRTLSLMNSQTTWEVVFLVGLASTHLVKYSILVMMYECPAKEEGLIGPIKSIPHCWKGLSITTGLNEKVAN